MIPTPCFNSCLAYVGASSGAGGLSSNHLDKKNPTKELCAICDGHVCLTQSPNNVLVIHCYIASQNVVKAHVVVQSYLATTFFHGNCCPHFACDANAFLAHAGIYSMMVAAHQVVSFDLSNIKSEIICKD